MPKAATEQLIELIKSLTKSEKRNFRLFVNRDGNASDKLFVQVFDILEKAKYYDESKILSNIPTIKPSQLSNIKANLYKQLLSSLRHVRRKNELDIVIRDNLDYSRILYSKGLYRASLSMLDKTKKLARKNGFFSSALAALEFEKFIESQYVTGSMYPKAKTITNETEDLMNRLDLTHKLSNLSLSMYGLYLQFGHVKRGSNYEYVRKFIQSRLPEIDYNEMDFYQKLYFSQSHVWYYFMIQDFPNNYRHAQRWVDLFEEYPEKKESETTLYLKGLHNVLSALFMNQAKDRFTEHYELLMNYGRGHLKKLNINDIGQLKLYQCIHTIHDIFTSAEYSKKVRKMKQIEAMVIKNPYNWDDHRTLVLKYKIACVYFGANKKEKAISILNVIINKNYNEIREDIQCYARILSLAAHFDLGNERLVSYQVKSVYRFLLKTRQEQIALKEIFKFLRKTTNMLPYEIKDEFIKLRDILIPLQDDLFERRPFIYFDIISWLEHRINNTTIEEEVQKKMSHN